MTRCGAAAGHFVVECGQVGMIMIEEKESDKVVIYTCREHVELALDVAVDTFECAPVMEALKQEDPSGTICTYCKNQATYKVFK